MQQAHRDHLHLAVVEQPRKLIHIVFNHTFKHGAGRIEPLRKAEGQVGIHQRGPGRDEDVVQLGPGLPADLEHVLKSARGDQGDASPLPLKHGIGGHGGPMDHVCGTTATGQVADAVQNGPGRVVGGGPLFVDNQPGRSQLDKIGKGSACINSETRRHARNSTGACLAEALAKAGPRVLKPPRHNSGLRASEGLMTNGMRILVVGGLMVGALGTGGAIGGVSQEPDPPRVLVANKPHQRVPVEAMVTMIKQPVALHEDTTVALKVGTVVKIEPPTWQYREIRVPTTPGGQSSVVSALSSAGADGWETTGLSFTSPGHTIIVLKRQR
jgi:hypothetical protein